MFRKFLAVFLATFLALGLVTIPASARPNEEYAANNEEFYLGFPNWFRPRGRILSSVMPP